MSVAPGTGIHIATYERRVRASQERVWENVLDWEHLPWLHSDAFRAIEPIGAGEWGWRARVGLHSQGPAVEIGIELLTERDHGRYVTRTTDGPGKGGEIWTQVTPASPDETDIRVDFFLPDTPGVDVSALGPGYVSLYTKLWDEDEAMMQQRAAELRTRADASDPSDEEEVVELGKLAHVRAQLPLAVTFRGRPFRVVEVDGALVAHSTVCPHWLGPLEGAVENGEVVCPWHGYRFDVRLARSCDGRGLRMARAPVVEVDTSESTVRLRSS